MILNNLKLNEYEEVIIVGYRYCPGVGGFGKGGVAQGAG